MEAAISDPLCVIPPCSDTKRPSNLWQPPYGAASNWKALVH